MSTIANPMLALAAEMLDDTEHQRIASENRLRSLTRSTEDSDGYIRGFGLTTDHPDVMVAAKLLQRSRGKPRGSWWSLPEAAPAFCSTA